MFLDEVFFKPIIKKFNNPKPLLLKQIKQMILHNDFIVFDTETTGLNNKKCEFIQIAYRYKNEVKNFIIKPIFEKYEIVKKRYSYDLSLSKSDFDPKKHLILIENAYKNGQDIIDVLNEVANDFKDHIVVAHNGMNFDFAILKSLINRLDKKHVKINPFNFYMLDSMRLIARYGVYDEDNKQVFAQPKIGKALKIKNPNAHNALGDTKQLQDILKYITKDEVRLLELLNDLKI